MIILFVLFFVITYCCIGVTLLSSVTISLLLSVLFLNVFYPMTRVTEDAPDFCLIVYACVQILSLVVIVCYVIYKGLYDIRGVCPNVTGERGAMRY